MARQRCVGSKPSTTVRRSASSARNGQIRSTVRKDSARGEPESRCAAAVFPGTR
jgi:hypothetical protein